MQSLPGGGLRIGAAVRLNDVAANPRVSSDWPVLREAVHKAASAQLRNLATIGGNLLQKTRCAYFRSEEQVPCNRRELGSGCGARQGRSDRHALFGWTEDCVATHPADPAVALAALDAEVLTRRPDGGRRIPVRELHHLPGDRIDADTVLEPDELIVALELAAPARHSAYVKVRERKSYEYALVSAAVTVELADDGTILAARIALGSVALRPWRLEQAERWLPGLRPDDPRVTEALDAAMSEARPAGQSSYKVAASAARASCGPIRSSLLVNYAETHPVSGHPWSSKKLRECYEDGARAFGWRGRPSEPGRDGPWLVGQGMADCGMGCFRNPSDAQVRLRADGTARIESGFQDIGTGTLTIFPQIVGDVLGLEPGLVSCAMGDAALPEAGPTYGSSSTMGVGAAVMAAAQDFAAGEAIGSRPRPHPGRRRPGRGHGFRRPRGLGRKWIFRSGAEWSVRAAYLRRHNRRGRCRPRAWFALDVTQL